MARSMLVVPMYIRAKSRDALVKAMVVNNMKWNASFDYYLIQKEGKEWVAWYNHDFKSHPIPSIIDLGGNNGN